MATYSQVTYQQIIDAIRSEINDEALAGCSPEWMQSQILLACQHITDNVRVTEKRSLNLIVGQEEFPFQNSTEPTTGSGTMAVGGVAGIGAIYTGTGTITSSSTTITGSGTTFLTQLAVGEAIIVGTQISEIASIESNTALTLIDAFTTEVTASAFSYSSTKFVREIVAGSIIVINGISLIVSSVTDPYNLVFTAPPTTNIGYLTYMIDTVVTEIPTKFDSIIKIDRTQDGLYQQIEIVDMNTLLDLRTTDQWACYSTYNIPFNAAIDMRAGTKRVLVVYPIADVTKSCTIHARIKINPRTHSADTLLSYVPLSESYEPTITNFVKWKVFRWLANITKQQSYLADAQMEYALLTKSIHDLVVNSPSLQRIDYGEYN